MNAPGLSLPVYEIMAKDRFFLRLKVVKHPDAHPPAYRLVLEGDAATKVLSEWSVNRKDAIDAFDAERARYR